ncbi:MAG: hypothetical protein ACE10C_08580 [Candidatus Binatia bacterium]
MGRRDHKMLHVIWCRARVAARCESDKASDGLDGPADADRV